MATKRKTQEPAVRLDSVTRTRRRRTTETLPVGIPAGQSARGLRADIVIGTLVRLDEAGVPSVSLDDEVTELAIPARSTVVLRNEDLGRKVVVVCEGSDCTKPIVLGVIAPSANSRAAVAGLQHELKVDGERLVLTAEREIVLSCGDATIVLTRAGKILIRGAYVLSRSSGVNRVKGASVQIN